VAGGTVPGADGSPAGLAGLFILFNVALVVVAVLRPALPEISGWFKYLAVYPFFVWHGATFFIGLILILSMIITLPLRVFGWVSGLLTRMRRTSPVPVPVPVINASVDSSRRVFLRRSMYGLTASPSPEARTASCSANDLRGHTHGYPVAGASLRARGVHHRIDQRYSFERVHAETGHGPLCGDDELARDGHDRCDGGLRQQPALRSVSVRRGVQRTQRSSRSVRGSGNHDYFTREVDRVAREVDACGIRLLRNDRVTVERNGASLALLGVDDVGRPDQAVEAITAALRGRPRVCPASFSATARTSSPRPRHRVSTSC